ncbi:uncharacterized protein NPIL_407781 [Nephila pilipes]|uniref:Uncharacterized protein n=1 Tax=Nephila pilipes TaxID=299642 RepID=A0A8X6MV85_NEPPI|nr:uncharacterized protein NPIL_407781 [Nephila pilipes]
MNFIAKQTFSNFHGATDRCTDIEDEFSFFGGGLLLKRRTIDCLTPKMLPDESIFYRFSKARNFNIKEAETMLRKYMDFRREYQIDTIVTDYNPPEVLNIYTPTSFFGFDKEGFVLRYIDVGEIDVRGKLI